ncbi:MAG: serine hydrolase [Polyangiales bacterium]
MALSSALMCALGASAAGAQAPVDPAASESWPARKPRPATCDGKPLPASPPGPFAVGPKSAGLPDYWPTEAWQSRPPTELGFDPAKLAAAVDFKVPQSRNQAVLVIRHGYVAAEKYTNFSATQTHESYSMAKSVSSGLVGIAIAEGKLASVDEKVCKFYPSHWNCSDASDARSRITVQHAMDLTTNLQWSEDWRSTKFFTPNDAATAGNDMLGKVLGRKTVGEPGSGKRYSTGDPALLTEVLRVSTGLSPYDYAKQKVFDVLGMKSVRWNRDAAGRTTTYMGVQATAQDFARYGYLFLRRGVWNDKQVIPADWIEKTTQATDPCNTWVQNLWHQNLPARLAKQKASCDGLWCTPDVYEDLPADGFFAEGVQGQFVFVVPSADLVVVRYAQDQMGSEFWDDYARGFMHAILGAIQK